MIKLISIDPSMRHTALVCFNYDTTTGKFSYVDSVTVNTEKADKKKKIRASSDLIKSCRELYEGVHSFVEKHSPQVIISETPSGSQSASGMKSYGVSCFLLGTLSPSPIEVTPIEVKTSTVGKKTASKKEMIEWAFERHPEVDWKLGRDGMPQITTEEHLADAIAVAYTGVRTPDFIRLKEFLK